MINCLWDVLLDQTSSLDTKGVGTKTAMETHTDLHELQYTLYKQCIRNNTEGNNL